MQKKHPDKNGREIAKLITQKYYNLPEKKKEKLNQQYQKNKEQFEEAKKKYEKKYEFELDINRYMKRENDKFTRRQIASDE